MSTQRMPAVGERQGAVPRAVLCSADRERRATVRELIDTQLELHETDCGESTMAALREGKSDCLIVDHRLPGMRAAELLRQLRDGADPTLPVIVLGEGLAGLDVEQLIELGAFQLCALDDNGRAGLRTAVRSALGLRRQQAELAASRDQLKKTRAELRAQQRRDPLTRLHNSSAFYEELDLEFRRSARSLQPLSLLIADIDCFTPYNYTYGQEAGDRCLRDVARALGASFQRAGDVVARITGASFAVLLPATDNDDCADQAERLRKTVWGLGLLCSSSQVADRITLSVGVATIHEDWDRGSAYLMQSAQTALMHAKNQGRNWVEVAQAV